jgi:hypothetical protein
MTINTELFQKIYDQITLHPEQHDQAGFEYRDEYRDECGTIRCIAGWAVAIHYGVNSIYGVEYGPGRDTEWGYLSDTAAEAADLLGLDDTQATDLFYDMDNESAVKKCHYYATNGGER